MNRTAACSCKNYDYSTNHPTSISNRISRAADFVVDFVIKKVGVQTESEEVDVRIDKYMEVVSACGRKIGQVNSVESGMITLTNCDSSGQSQLSIPLGWISRIDDKVHLCDNDQKAEACGSHNVL